MEIRFEPNTTQAQKEACLLAAYMDKQDKITRAHSHPFFLEAKSVMRNMMDDILLERKKELNRD